VGAGRQGTGVHRFRSKGVLYERVLNTTLEEAIRRGRDDRLKIISSGELHFGLTPEMLFQPHESKPWNPLLAHVFYRLGLIETWGRGTL